MRRGSQEPTFQVAPVPVDGFDSLDGDDCVGFAKSFGLVLDPWQAELCRLWMRRDSKSGRWVAGTWGISVPRQNGKNGTLEAVELYGMVVLGLRFLHTAHEVKTAVKHFRRLKEFFGEKRDDPNARHPELNRLVRSISSGKGQEAIYLMDPGTGEPAGSIEIVARTGGSGRGFTNDVLVFDEAQHLKDDELEASRPAISAAPSGDPVAIYMGTPPKPEALVDEGRGSAFVRVRTSVMSGESKRAAWMEFSHDIDLDQLSDAEIRAVAEDMSISARVNPALGRRLFEQTLVDELTELGPRSYCRERLNVWPRLRRDGEGVIDLEAWAACELSTAEVEGPDVWPLAAVGLDMDSNGRLWVAMAAHGPDPAVHVELLPDDLLADGVDAVVKWVYARCRKRRPIGIPSDSGATVLAAPLLARGCKVHQLNSREQDDASAGLVLALKDGSVTHLADPVLQQAVGESTWEELRNGARRFGRSGELFGAPLLAFSSARFAASKWSRRSSSASAGAVYELS